MLSKPEIGFGPEVGLWEVGHSTRGFAYFRRMTEWQAEKEFGVKSSLMKGHPPLDGA
jgi:hypothetical protein